MGSRNNALFRCAWLGTCILLGSAAHAQRAQPVIDEERLAREHFGADAPWFRANIPFLEIDDADIQKVYYYRWQLYRSHLREFGAQGTGVTEFLPDVPWARHPYTELNDSSSFHIMEGRWLRDPAFVGSLVDHLYAGGGNDRHFSESIAAATLAWTQVTGNTAPALRHLDAMQHIYNLWDDHFDARRNLYWIEPLLDATEYTISSIDASGAGFAEKPGSRDNENGFTGGYAFRPSINAYQFANAAAIATLALAAGKPELAHEYTRRAEALRHAVLGQLWNEPLQHFTDVYQRSTATVTAGEFIRGRELVGYLPWMYELPPHSDAATDNTRDFAAAWQHALRPAELGGPFGLRTVEPSYPRYMQQYRYDRDTGLRECQWNGPSWPFQTSQTLTAMANLLHDYKQQTVTADDYVRLLRQYTREHLTASGAPDLQEDYDPDTGKPIVGLPRSHHYNHSTYNDIVLSGLLGIKPRSDDVLEIDPLLAKGGTERPIRYFALQGLRYHGHDLTVVYDADGKRYRRGDGLTVISDGKRIYGPAALHHALVPLPHVPPAAEKRPAADLAVNVWNRPPTAYEANLPIASASSTAAGSSMYEAIDGRLWFFPEIANGWSPETCEAYSATPDAKADAECWFAIDLRHFTSIESAKLFFFAGGKDYRAPLNYRLQRLGANGWEDIPGQGRTPATPLANGTNEIRFPRVATQHIRVVLTANKNTKLRLIEFEVYAGAASPEPYAARRPVLK